MEPDATRACAMRLYASPGSCSRVTLVALEEAGVHYECRLVWLKRGDHRGAEFLTLNPKGKVPVLETDEGVLTENVAILAYLADRYPEASLLPAGGALGRAQGLSALCWCSSTMHPRVTLLRYPEKACDAPGTAGRVRELARLQLAAQMLVAESTLALGPWILGQAWSIADAYLSWCWGRCEEAGLAPSDFPRLADHHLRVQRRPSAQRAARRESLLSDAAG